MSDRPLHFAVMLGGGSEGFREYDSRVDLVESLGYDGVWAGHGGRGYDTFQLLTRTSTRHPRLRLGTSVTLLPLLDPVEAARQVATLDQMSEGKLLFGAGVGGDRGPDFTIHGIDPHTRGRRMDEQLQIMRALWAGETVDFQGEFFNVKGALQIKPHQSRMPILIGGRGGRTPVSQRIYDRIVRWGDGWIPYITTPEYYARGQQAIRERGGNDDLVWALVQHAYVGTGDGQAAIDAAVARKAADYGQAGAPPDAQAERMRPLVLAGNAEACAQRLMEYIRLGVSEVMFNWACPPEEIPEQIKRVAEDVIPRVRELAAAERTGAAR